MLVHCIAGISRSATVVMAHIMASQQLDCPRAFRVLKKAHKATHPNEGFRNQLKIFDSMGGKIDNDHPEYKLYKLQVAVDDYNDGHVENIPMAADPETTAGSAAAAATFAFAGRGELIRCKKCRRKLAYDNNFLEHDPGSGQVAFRWHKRETAMTSPLTAAKEVQTKQGLMCTSIFVEPIGWMADLIADGMHEGNLCTVITTQHNTTQQTTPTT